MQLFFEHTCHKCGSVGELDFCYAGPHIKAVCSHCGFYVKFFDKKLIPDTRTIKMRIMASANGDIELIHSKKLELGLFYPGISGFDEKLAYWKLYLLFLRKK